MKFEILYFVIPFLISAGLIPLIITVAKSYQLYDLPSYRKLHHQPKPALGGVAIFCSFGLVMWWSSATFYNSSILYFSAALFMIFASGLWDDLRNISARKRLVIQCMTAVVSIAGGHSFVSDYGLLNLGEIPLILQYIITVFFIVLVINAFNLIDGVNGLAGCLALYTSLSFAYLFADAGDYFWATLALGLSGSTLGFLKYNFAKASIFMGDNGSTFIGLALAIFMIQYINLPVEASGQYQNFISGLSLLLVPILDLLRVSFGRIKRGLSPFHADQSHVHHLLLRSGYSHPVTTIIILIVQLLVYILSQFLLGLINPLSIGLAIACAYLLFIKMINISQDLTSIKTMENDRRALGRLY